MAVCDWEGLLACLPQDDQARFDALLRRSLVRRRRKLGEQDLPVPDAVRSQAVGAWRKRYGAGMSKAALRRKGYERLRHDPTYLALERELAQRYWKRREQQVARLENVDALTFAEACEAYRALQPRLEGTALASAAHEVCAHALDGLGLRDELLEEMVRWVCSYVSTRDLTELGAPRTFFSRGRAFRQMRSRRSPGFTLAGLTTEREVAARVRGSNLVEHVVERRYGRSDLSSAFAHELCVQLAAQPTVAALGELLDGLFDDEPLQGVLKHLANKEAEAVRRYQASDEFMARVVAALLQNPAHGAQFRRSVELRLRVRESVPETPMEAYPLARTMHRHFVVHVGPTNSGKTHDAMEALMAAPSGAYLGPLRLLAYEQFERMNHEGCPCTLLTGEELIEVAGARHVSSTVEMADFHRQVSVVVIDEAQMMADPDRGYRWTAAILGIPADVVHVCCAPHAERIVCSLVRLCDDSFEVVRHERLVPLECERRSFRFPDDVRAGDALIVFSRRAVHEVAEEVMQAGLRASLVYGALPHDVRHEEARRFDEGETDVVVATDAIGMGMNLPIRRIVFVEQEKYDGREMRLLKPEEIQQIAGRAGRYGRYDLGLFATTRLRGKMEKLWRQRVDDIDRIAVGIPDNIALVRGATLSEAIVQWAALEQPQPFVRLDIGRDLALIREVEERLDEVRRRETDVKLKVLALATMAFDERDRVLHGVWRRIVDAELRGEEAALTVPEDPVEGMRLDELEARYRLCDLLYSYARTFGHATNREELMRRRDKISHVMMGMLAARG